MSDATRVTKRAVTSLCLCLLWFGAGCEPAHEWAPKRDISRLGSLSSGSGPLIGITSVYEPAKGNGPPNAIDRVWEPNKSAETTVGYAYVRAVAENGGVPVVLPTVDDERVLQRYLSVLDGLVLIGGDDIPPEAYGKQPHKTVQPLTKERYEFERKLIARWLAGGRPLLGVCLGMQFTNVVSGGSLIQDIPSEIGTRVNHKAYHRVQIEPGSTLAHLLGATDASVLSSHHQAVEKLGRNLRPIAHSEDGVVEALERTDGPFGLFVQWHPESMTNLVHRDAIYGALIQAAARRR